MSKTFDVVLYGATGFTGGLVAEYMAKAAPAGMRWAIAGRSSLKLTQVADSLYKISPDLRGKLGLITVSAASLHEMTSVCRVVMSTVGPFELYGEPLIKSCIEDKCDYVDITGEVGWVKRMIDKYGAAAQSAGVIIVNMCGFDSIPADLGTLYLIEQCRCRYLCGLASVTGYVSLHGMELSGGTVASALVAFERSKQTGFTPTLSAMDVSPYVAARSTSLLGFLPFYSHEVSSYLHYFLMSGINTAVVQHSAALFAACDKKSPNRGLHPYSSSPFRYTEYCTSRGLISSVAMTIVLALMGILLLIPGGPSLLKWLAPKQGEGPSQAQRDRASFTYKLVGHTDELPQRTIAVVVAGGDGGYTETSKMVSEAAIALAHYRGNLPAHKFGCGFLTPATAFGHILIDRLRTAGLRFEALSTA